MCILILHRDLLTSVNPIDRAPLCLCEVGGRRGLRCSTGKLLQPGTNRVNACAVDSFSRVNTEHTTWPIVGSAATGGGRSMNTLVRVKETATSLKFYVSSYQQFDGSFSFVDIVRLR
jgi:hypothetical protein